MAYWHDMARSSREWQCAAWANSDKFDFSRFLVNKNKAKQNIHLTFFLYLVNRYLVNSTQRQ